MTVRSAILQHMINVGHLILGHHVLSYSSIQDYIADTNMDRESAWDTDIEMLTLAHLLQTPILSYNAQHRRWSKYVAHDLDRTLNHDATQMSMYLLHIDTTILRLYAQYVNKQFVTIFKTRNMQHPCLGYFLDPKCEVKSATMITDIVCGERGGKLHMVPPYYQTNMNN